MDLKGRWPWFMLTLVKVISSQQLCPNNCLQCDLNIRCLKCVDGYYGELCNIPCDPVCRNGKCRIDGSCRDIIERAVWKIRRMRRNTGVNCHDAECRCCKSNYRGPNCQVGCPNCRTRYTSGACDRYCEAGFYGGTCDENCPEKCAPGNAGKPLCKKDTGECSNNCKPGSWGRKCNKTCPKDCKGDICLPISGSCVDCNGISYGVECKEKCHGCKEGCYKNGTCVQGCAAGYHGELCDRRCGTDCSEGGRCRLYTGQPKVICLTECQYIPASPNVIEGCIAAASSEDDSLKAETNTPAIVVPVVIIIIIIIVVGILVFILWRKKRCYFRQATGEMKESVEAKTKLISEKRKPTEETTGHVEETTEHLRETRTPDDEVGLTGSSGEETNYLPNRDRVGADEPTEKVNVKPKDTPRKEGMGADEPTEKMNVKPKDTPRKERMGADEPTEKMNVKPKDTPRKERVDADEPTEKVNVKPKDTPRKEGVGADEPTEKVNVKPKDTSSKERVGADEPTEKVNVKPKDTSSKERIGADEPTEKVNVKPKDTSRKESGKVTELEGLPRVQEIKQMFEKNFAH